MHHPLELFKYCPKCGSSAFVENNEKSKRCEDCGFVYYFNASSATVAFILNEQGELLVCRRAKEPKKGTLDLVGGFVDRFETGEDCRVGFRSVTITAQERRGNEEEVTGWPGNL